MLRHISIIFIVLFLNGCATFGQQTRVVDDVTLDDITYDELTKFEGEREFKSYLKDVKRRAKRRGIWWAGTKFNQYAQLPECEKEPCEDEIVVTGSKAATSASSSITNTQKQGVDEGDIVKQFGNFLIVLQDGRLFTVDTGNSSSEMRVVDRANVYQNQNFDAWYDELLIFEDNILVTGYSYEAEATELAVFKIDKLGKIAHQGTFYKSSDDYYDADNYATRLVDDKLIIYAPLYLTDIDVDEPFPWPVIRKWIRGTDLAEPYSKGRHLFDARDIYKPLQRTLSPVVHTVSICPLGNSALKPELDCETKAFIGPEQYEYYVSRSGIYLWISPGYDDLEIEGTDELDTVCEGNETPKTTDAVKAMLFEIPVSGGRPKAIEVRGTPKNQFSLETTDMDFRALLTWDNSKCQDYDSPQHVKYFNVSLDYFRRKPIPAGDSHFIDIPMPGTPHFENRFTEKFLVYGGRKSWRSRPYYWNSEEDYGSAPVVVVPTENPKKSSVLSVDHDIIRAERAGDNIVLTGYRDAMGLSLSMVDLSGEPNISDTIKLGRRFESEGRSHAFNSIIQADGSGMIGLPTVEQKEDSDRWWWRSDASDVSFLSVNQYGQLSDLGSLQAREGSVDDGYKCEMSCIDWYGNSRPIFIGTRIFGLTGTELIEGYISGNRISERARINLSKPIPSR